MEVGKRAGRSVWKTEKGVHDRTRFSDTRYRRRNESEADASDYAAGGVLSIKCEDGKWRPVAFISKLLNTTEQNYEIHDKEMLAVIRCLEAWRHYLEGAKLEFEIWTDHKNLQYFMTSQKLNRR